MKNLVIIVIIFVLGACTTPEKGNESRDYVKTETAEEIDQRMLWWRDAGLGMFIHWGLYSVPAGQYGDETNHAEWIQETANITVEEYEKYAMQFNPIKFNAKIWAKIAKEAGMKYIVITSKHHDGFCLWDSKVSDYDIIDRTPYKKDVLKELADACKEEGIAFCFYYSIMDWHHPKAQGINYPNYNTGKGPNPEFPKYSEEYMKPQLKELLTNYGDIGILWFDGEWIEEWTEEQGKELYNYVRKLQPNIIINNRVGKGRQGMQGMNEYEDAAGDYGTPEQEILDGSTELDWESCMTMNGKWGYNKFDKDFKSTKVLIHNLIDIAAKGGNYLLNVGPTDEGLIPSESITRLKEIGDWMKVNNEVIYNSRGTKHYKENKSTYYIKSNDDKYLYAVFTQWPGTLATLKYAIPETGSDIYLLGYDKPLTWISNDLDEISLELPKEWQNEEKRPVKYAWVIKIEGKQARVVETPKFEVDSLVVNDKMLLSEEIEVRLKCSTEGATIIYQIIKEGKKNKSMTYLGPIKISNVATILATAHKEGFINSDEAKLNCFKVSNVKSINYKYPYSNKYPAMGSLTLADGILGDKENYTESWLGFEGDDMVATIDIGKEKIINKLSVNFMQNTNSWIFFPEYIEVSLSTDGKKFKTVAKVKTKIDMTETGALTKIFEARFEKIKSRFVRIKAKNIGVCPEWHKGAGNKAWVFTDEIIIE